MTTSEEREVEPPEDEENERVNGEENDDTGDPPPQTDEAEIEARARAMGWFPEDEWDEERARREGRKKPARFLSAAEFIERTEASIPIMRETTRRLSKQITDLHAEQAQSAAKLTDIGRLVESLHRQNKAIGKREYERGRADALAARKKAIEDGDVDGVDRADEALRQLDDLRPEEPETPAPPPAQPERPPDEPRPRKSTNPAVDAWVKENSWFTRDPVLNAFVIEEHARLMREHPGVPEEDLLDEAKALAQEQFPAKFGINRRRAAPPSVGRPTPPAPRNDRKSFAGLSPDLKADFKRQQAYMKELGIDYTEDEFMAGLEQFGGA